MGIKSDALFLKLRYYSNRCFWRGSDHLLVNVTRNTCLATAPRVADSFFSRLKGLLGTNCLPKGAALLITPCSSVHTFGMAYPIDVLFIGTDNKVLKVVTLLRPGRAACCGNSRYVIELPAGAAAVSQTQVGDEIAIQANVIETVGESK